MPLRLTFFIFPFWIGVLFGCGSSGAAPPSDGAAAQPGPGSSMPSGGSPAASEPSVPAGLSGVVVVENDMASCVPLCTVTTDAAGDPEGDDWSFENGASCVIPGTVTGQNQACVTGEPLPEALSVPGVVVVNNEEGTTTCVPLCVVNTDPAEDPEGDDWSWENNQSCVIPGTLTGANQSCMTLEPIPEPEPRPGVILAVDDEPACVPVCRVATEPSDMTQSSDWAYENNESCVLPDTETAAGRRECTWGEFPPDYKPPALSGAKVAEGFYTENGRLYDAYGQDFVIRGINNAHIWFDGYANYLAWGALDNIASYGTNTVRVVWETTGSPSLLADILLRIVELHMVPMIELHDATGVRAPERLLMTAEYYTRADVLPVLQDFREYLLINVANEWSGNASGDDNVYLPTYQTVIDNLRSAGIEHTLVIDASGFGQNAQSLFDNAEPLMASDPQNNLLFSIHMYDLFADAERVQTVLSDAVAASLPLIVGEFGYQLSGTDVAWQQILDSCEELGLGYIVWSWTGNDADTAHLDLAEDWEGPLTEWGENSINGQNGISETAEPASIFQEGTRLRVDAALLDAML